MLVASSMGATAFQRGLGAMHALAHPLGALYDAHHGTLNAVLMQYVLKANRTSIGDRMDVLARYLRLPTPGFDGVLEWVLALRRDIGIVHTLAELGMDEARADLISQMAVIDGAAGTNPIVFEQSTYRKIFINAVRGQL
jgi:alcohol dehydrogenase class IV